MLKELALWPAPGAEPAECGFALVSCAAYADLYSTAADDIDVVLQPPQAFATAQTRPVVTALRADA
ncbi:MAG: hypothetical protein K2X76_16105 [Sphingomonas sp.]|nr:hypothetical protein [Sphingomonas sp.]